MAVMNILRASSPIFRQEISTPLAFYDSAQILGEAEGYSFRIDTPEEGLEYRICIGDLYPERSVGEEFGGAIWWKRDTYFESARGRVTVHLFSRSENSGEHWTRRIAVDVVVVPTKIGDARYDAMLESLRAISMGLVFDLLSKSRVLLGLSVMGKLSSRPASFELTVLNRLWSQLSGAIREISSQPQAVIAKSRIVEIPLETATVGREELNAMVARGLNPRHTLRLRGQRIKRRVNEESMDTSEHRTMAALLQLLSSRVADCGSRASAQAALLRSERPMRDVEIDGHNLYRETDIAKLDRLQGAIAESKLIQQQMRLALALPPFRGLHPRLGSLNTPIFNHVLSYKRFRDESLAYLRNAVAVLDEGVEERSKATHRMYEQWVFLQVLAALREVGLIPMSQEALLSKSLRNRFTIDLDRGTRVIFQSRDGRSVSVRYEPWIYPKGVAQAAHDSVYKGKRGDVPWSPDLLIEIFSADGAGATQAEYAVVIDAKYSNVITEDQKRSVSKYFDIRGVEDDRPLVKQVWIVHPGDEDVTPWDDAISWTNVGPDRPQSEMISGTVGMSPPTEVTEISSDNVNAALLDFIRSLLRYLRLIPFDAA